MMIEEIWKPIKGHQGYEISDTGRVRSLKRKGIVLMKLSIDRGGYYYINLTHERKTCSKKVHRLVCEHFNGSHDSIRTSVDHIDGNKLNNKSSNLRWCTHQENILFAWQNGLYTSKGEKHYNSSLDLKKVLSIKNDLSKGISCKEIAKKNGVTNWCIHDIKQKRTWKDA